MHVNSEALLRALPDVPDIVAKIGSGQFTVGGGVVRHSAGTQKGGQIVGHLVFPGDSLQTQKSLQELQATLSNGLGSLQGGVEGLQQSMNALQALQSANLVMAGLNLAVTTAGFVVVCRKLDKISAQIEAQGAAIAETLSLVREVYERDLLRDEAKFRALLRSSQQFCEEADGDLLKGLIPRFHEEYQFTKLVLVKHASRADSNLRRLPEIALLQDRLVHIGLVMSHVQLKAGAATHAQQCLSELAADIRELNATRINALIADRSVASAFPRSGFASLTEFLKNGSVMIPALAYQADVMGLEAEHPGLLGKVSELDEIMLVAA